MEVFSAVAAAISLGDLSRVAIEFRRRVQNGPRELAHAASRVEFLSHELQGILGTQHGHIAEFISSNTCSVALEKSIRDVEEVIAALRVAFPDHKTKYTAKNSAGWVLSRRKTYDELMQEFTRCEISLTTVLNLFLWHEWHADRSRTKEMEKGISAILLELRSPKGQLESAQRFPGLLFERSTDDSTADTIASFEISCPKNTPNPPIISGSLLWGLCLSTATVAHLRTYYSSIWVSSLQIKLPGRLILQFDMLLRLQVWRWLNNLSLGGSRFSVKHYVPPDSPFMVASAQGDEATMRSLLQQKRASPFEVTEEGVTPLCLAIQGGHCSAVELLLRCGADVNDLFGQKQTSALSWALKHRHHDVCRLLLRNRASFHHLSVWGWSPLFYLWSRTTRQPLSLEFIQMLQTNEIEFPSLHDGLIDIEGWALMHRAAIFAMPEDLLALMGCGVGIYTACWGIKWTPLHVAVSYGAYDNFVALLPYYHRKYGIEMRDGRGWTLLHIAAARGHGRIIRKLLELGASWQALTDPDVGQGLECPRREVLPGKVGSMKRTPAEIAHAYGDVEYACFVRAVEEVLGDQVPEVDIWLDADQCQ